MDNIKNKHIIVAMSGGVDSSVTALLLKEQGYQVTGLFMKNWEEDDTDSYCSATQDLADLKAVCERLQIPLETVNFAAEYWDTVFEHFLSEYRAGRTPNPDIWCNKEIKFKAFLDYAKQLGGDLMATGHYVQKNQQAPWQLQMASDQNKDQSYFLYTLNQTQLAASLFPIGHLPKPEVRARAKAHDLVTHNKKDSTGICFIGERKFKDFLSQYLPAQPGAIEDDGGQVIGRHQGLMYHTIGQRKGLAIGGVKDRPEKPWYVLSKDLTRNVLVVGQDHDHPALYQSQLCCNDLHWVAGTPPAPGSYQAKTRYRQPAVTCQIGTPVDGELSVDFENPEWAITPGQAIVFYQGEVCLGGGTIL